MHAHAYMHVCITACMHASVLPMTAYVQNVLFATGLLIITDPHPPTLYTAPPCKLM